MSDLGWHSNAASPPDGLGAFLNPSVTQAALDFHGGLSEMSLGPQYLVIPGNGCGCFKTPNGKVFA